ncbi:MAG: FkbM family methyltransferase [Candidatus Acidiferrales bacterium]
MQGARKWMGELLLHSPAPLRSLRDVPVLGGIIHRLSHRILPADEKVWAQIEVGPAKGIWMELNPRTSQSYVRGEAEIAVQQSLAERIQSGIVFYDLGANIGLFTLLAARLVGAGGKVYSFEPDPSVAARLRRNIARNGFENVTVTEAGVWSTTGEMKFVAADSSSPDHGLGRLVPEDDDAPGTPSKCIALDDFVKTSPPPHAIKCDVESAEVEVFRGAENLLESHRPWIVCEIHSPANDRELRTHLGRFGYSLESLDANHVLALPQGKQ